MRFFVGITGASGAPYAARLLDGLRDAGAEIGVCASSSAGEVIAYEIYRDRAAGVALTDDRRPVLVPRETPLSAIHLEAMLKLRQAGALMLPAMPAFYTLPETLDDIVDFVAGKALDLLGVEHDLLRRWGQAEREA